MDPQRVAHLESTTIPEKRMVYMVCDHFAEPKDRSYSIFALDLSEGVKIISDESPTRLPEPIFQLDKTYPTSMGCFSLGNKIYFFGGFRYLATSSRSFHTPVSEDSLNTYVCDMSEKTIVEGPFLKAPKLCPVVVHLNRKVYVLSSSFGGGTPSPHFEVFHPDLQMWEGLPRPRFHANAISRSTCRRYHALQIRAHAVLGTTLFISMPVGIYSFDVEKPRNGWTHLPVFNGVSEFPFIQNAALVNKHWLSLVGQRNLIISYDPHEENGLTEGKGKTFYSISPHLPWSNQILLFNSGNSELGMVNRWCNKNTEYGAIYFEGIRLFYEFYVFQTKRFMEFEERQKKVAKQDTYTSASLSPNSYKVTFVTDDYEMTTGTIVAVFPVQA